jgi:hypothetical protein
MKQPFDEYHNCSVLGDEVNVTGHRYSHKSSTTPTPEVDFQSIIEFHCDHISTCKHNEENCPLRKTMQASQR